MTAAAGGNSSSSSSFASPAPKILLAKPALVPGNPSSAKFILGGGGGSCGAAGEDDAASIRSRLPPVSSLNLLSDSWEFHIDRFLPFLTDNTEFTVVGVIGPPGVGKSTVMNVIYGFDSASPGMLPPFGVQSEETRANARHCTSGIEPRVAAERIILLDTQPVFSAAILAEMTRPDGSSSVPVLSGENLSAELAHELMGIQLGVLLASICHILLVVSEGVHDFSMWHLMSTVDMLKHKIPDPSSLPASSVHSSNLGTEKETKDNFQEAGEEFMSASVFIHTKLHDSYLTPQNSSRVRKALESYFHSSPFLRMKSKSMGKEHLRISMSGSLCDNVNVPNLFFIPCKNKDESSRSRYESYDLALWNLRDQVLSMNYPSFSRTVTEREWLKNSARIWELVKNSSIIAEYHQMLQSSRLFRR